MSGNSTDDEFFSEITVLKIIVGVSDLLSGVLLLQILRNEIYIQYRVCLLSKQTEYPLRDIIQGYGPLTRFLILNREYLVYLDWMNLTLK